MNDRDRDRFEHEVTSGLRSAGRTIQPAVTLGDRVRDRLRARRRRRAAQVISASALVLAMGVSTLALTRDERHGRLETTDETVPEQVSDSQAPSPSDALPITAVEPRETFPAVDDTAINILVVGTDNGACVDPESPYAPGFGDRTTMGERSDTIMVIRVDPSIDQASILSFPRDLWVTFGGENSKGRISATYVRDDPQRLIDTISANFAIPVDHFVQIDFCGFTTIVNAVGGVSVPFDQPVRDANTGLDVRQAGCHTMDGDEALAYVRSRHFQLLVGNEWIDDPSSDLGRVARQQDFLQRTMVAVLDNGLVDAGLLRDLIGAVRDSVVVDTGLTISRMLEIARELRSVDPTAIGRYQIESEPAMVANNSVLVPTLETQSMQSILALFRGRPIPVDPAQPAETSAVPTVVPGDNLAGLTPPAISCP